MKNLAHDLSLVREQYEEFPYPERDPEDERTRLVLSLMSRFDEVNHHCFNGRQNFDNFRVLIAGGGTGDTLISWAEQLRDRKNAEVIYLDMSAASAAIAKKRAEVRKLDNIKWVQGNLLRLPDFNVGMFDFIDCAGVLHHLKDPDAGLKALKSVLKPQGAMNLMVYAPYARAGVYQIQALMRLVNGDGLSARQKICNTKEILKTLPQHHVHNLIRQNGWVSSDEGNDAGIYDKFLHSQDRAYTILEVYDWLERCGLRMAGEPSGLQYSQVEYLPDTYIKDEALLKTVRQYPVKIQHAIGEAMSGRMAKHEFFAVHEDTGEVSAQITEEGMILCKGLEDRIPFDEIAGVAAQRSDSFTIRFDKSAGTPLVFIPEGKYIATLLRHIDGKRSVAEVLAAVRTEHAGIDEAVLRAEFKNLFTALNRGHVLYLRHPSVAPFAAITNLLRRLN